MNSMWILAEAGPNTPEVIKAEDMTSQNQQQTLQTTTQAEPNSGKISPQNQWQSKNQWQSMIMIAMIFVILYFVMFRGPKKRQQQQEQMIKALKKNDRVQTIGGILGTVLDVSDNEITLKVDESNNTKIKVIPSAISRVIEQK